MNRFFKHTLPMLLICCVLAVPGRAEPVQQGFHRGDIFAVEKDARAIVASCDVTRYYISIQVDDNVYV